MESESQMPLILTWSITDSTTGKWQLEEGLTTEAWSGTDEELCVDGKRATPHTTALLLDQLPIEILTHGYVSPVLIFFTVLTNCMVCVVLLKKKIRTATNCLLVAMAISNMLTGVLPLPCFLYFYTAGQYREWVPYRWCFTYLCLTEYLPTVTHTASIWLNVALASQRFICVLHSKVCTVRNIIKVICVIYIFAFLSHCTCFSQLQFYPVTVWSRVDPQSTVTSCGYGLAPFVNVHTELYFNVYYWYRVVFIHLVPCLSLVPLNALLVVWTIPEAELKRRILQNRSECHRLMESNTTTLMLVVVVGLLVLVELPLAVLFLINVLENTLEIAIFRLETINVLMLVFNLVILLSYSLNFFIYFGMSTQFRNAFKGLFRRRRGHVHQRQQCTALERSTASENDSVASTSRCHGNKNKTKSFNMTTTIILDDDQRQRNRQSLVTQA